MREWGVAVLSSVASILLIVIFLNEAHAQEYPQKPITIVVPYSAAGAADLAARSLAQSAQKYLHQPIIVVNRTGANGIIGSESVLKSDKDGYTLLAARVGSQVVGPALDPSFPFGWDSFSIIGLLEIDPYVCVVNAKSPIKSIHDLIDAVKAHPGKLNYATSGRFDTSVVFPVKMLVDNRLKSDAAVAIPYKGGGETLAAVLGGQVDFACSPLAPYAGAIASGQLRALIVSTAKRVQVAPNAPTAREAGMPDLEALSGWTALYGPPDLPRYVLAKWMTVLEKVKNDAAWSRQVLNRGTFPGIMSEQATRQYVEAQFKAYRAIAPQLSLAK